jgi:hypothetical protein
MLKLVTSGSSDLSAVCVSVWLLMVQLDEISKSLSYQTNQ